MCVLAVVLRAASGPIFKFSETLQLVINTGATIISFLMVFLIQNNTAKSRCSGRRHVASRAAAFPKTGNPSQLGGA
jgi:low affinity Fe/Cu permease